MSTEQNVRAKRELILTFDIGTQSARALLVDKEGNVVDKQKHIYKQPYYSLNPNWAERDPEKYWDDICENALALKARNEDIWGDIIAVTCTCIRATAVCLDKEGKPVRDAIVWLDKREETNLPPLTMKSRALFKVAGLTDAAETLRTHMYCNWLAVNEPETWKKTYKYGMLSTFFNVKFTGVMKDSTANMCGIVPYDTKNRKWYPKNDFHREIYLIEDDKLLELVKPGTILGKITKEAAEATGVPEGLPYIVTGSDKMCETFGLSCTKNDTAAISLGTLSSIQVPNDKFFTIKMVLPPFPSLTGNYLNELQTYRGFWLVSWFKEQFGQKEVEEAKALNTFPEKLLDAQLKTITPGCDGLIMQPTLTPDAVTPNARGVFLGLTEVHTRMHFYRAVVEGIAFTLYDGLKTLEKSGKNEVKKIFIAGGGSNSKDICQIMADVMGVPVCRIQTDEACGLGSSILGFVSMGIYKNNDEAIKAMVHERDCFTPNKENHKLYKQIYKDVYSKMFHRLVKLYRNIDRIFLNTK